MASRAPILAGSRVAPLAASIFPTSVSLNKPVRDAVLSYPTIDFPPRPEDKQLHHYSSQLRLHLQWAPAAKMQLLMLRNTIICVVAAGFVNGCFYAGNIFSLKSSTKQSRPEFLMAMLVWTILCYATVMIISHLPSLMTQRFLECPHRRPGLWFCTKKLMIRSSPYFGVSLVGMISIGLLVQNTSLMHQYFKYKVHFYLGDLCSLVFTAGITLAVRRIYYEETYQGRGRRSAVSDVSGPRAATNSQHSPPSSPHRPPNYRTPSFWREYLVKFPDALMTALAGGFVHVVSWYHILNQGTVVIMGFTIFGILLKLALQEAARHYIMKKRIRSIRTMCVLVGVPTVLIDTQTRVVLLGTQTSSFLMAGTFAMVVAELCLRAAKAAFVIWMIRRRAKALELKLQQRSTENSNARAESASQSELKLEFELWRRQVLSYYTAELTADMYAEYIAIGCSQSIVFWYVGHPFYGTLQLEAGTGLSDIDLERWRFTQVVLLGVQFMVEVLVDYVCVVMEMAAGINYDRIESLSTFLGVLFMTIAVLNISISSAVYLS
ncbi:hypothetical protein PRIC1_004606 [Phytophthora ramorum]